MLLSVNANRVTDYPDVWVKLSVNGVSMSPDIETPLTENFTRADGATLSWSRRVSLTAVNDC